MKAMSTSESCIMSCSYRENEAPTGRKPAAALVAVGEDRRMAHTRNLFKRAETRATANDCGQKGEGELETANP